MDVVEGAARPDRREAAGNRKRIRPGDPIPALSFGDYGELTPRTIAQAGLIGEERKRAQEMLKVQAAYLSILDCLDLPVDPDGVVHDLSAIGPTKMAVAYTLALCGFRQTGKCYLARHELPGGRHTFTDARTPDAAPRPAATGEGWHVEPKITFEHLERQ